MITQVEVPYTAWKEVPIMEFLLTKAKFDYLAQDEVLFHRTYNLPERCSAVYVYHEVFDIYGGQCECEVGFILVPNDTPINEDNLKQYCIDNIQRLIDVGTYLDDK